ATSLICIPPFTGFSPVSTQSSVFLYRAARNLVNSPEGLAGCSKSPPASFSLRAEAQRTEAYASPLRSLRPCWTAFLSILRAALAPAPFLRQQWDLSTN